MKYCVIANTTRIIDGSENPEEIMLKNAMNAGFSELEVEILTEEEYQERKASEPQPAKQPGIEDYMIDLDYRLSKIELGL